MAGIKREEQSPARRIFWTEEEGRSASRWRQLSVVTLTCGSRMSVAGKKRKGTVRCLRGLVGLAGPLREREKEWGLNGLAQIAGSAGSF